MTRPRREQVDQDISKYYHCVARCVRRAFLCGDDKYSGQNFDHRKRWVLDRLAKLSDVFAIRVCAYAVMSNHLHLVLYIDQEAAQSLSDEEILKRYATLFATSARATLSLPENKRQDLVKLYRLRLGDLSWFMRCLSEHIARRANREDRCRGRFWEGRFRSQALLDDAALLACMSYVDLNPVRAHICETLEDSDFTSIQQRLLDRGVLEPADETVLPRVALVPCDEMPCDNDHTEQHVARHSSDLTTAPPPDGVVNAMEKNVFPTIPLSLEQYTELLVATGREIREDKPGVLGERAERILLKFGIVAQRWSATVAGFEKRFSLFAGRPENLDKASHRLGIVRTRGRAWSTHVFSIGRVA